MTRGVLCIIAAFLVVVSNAQTTLEDLQGEYEGQISTPVVLVITEEGYREFVCHDQLSQECRQELGPGSVRASVTDNTLDLDYMSQSNATSLEEAREAYPACAAEGRYPIRGVLFPYASEIKSYDSSTGYLHIVNPARPDDTQCLIVNLRRRPNGITLSLKYMFTANNVPQTELASGIGCRCFVANNFCAAGLLTTNNVIVVVDIDVEIQCRSGSCMNFK